MANIKRGIKIPLPFRRKGYIIKVKVGGHDVVLQTGEYADGSLGEIWVETQNSDSTTFRSILNCFAVSISMGLQRGVPLEDFIAQFVFYKFEPFGIVENHEELKIVTSIVDFIFRELGSYYLNRKDLVQIKGGPVENIPRKNKKYYL
jgi:ribonucleoside-diphosphate reductase alpha chain